MVNICHILFFSDCKMVFFTFYPFFFIKSNTFKVCAKYTNYIHWRTFRDDSLIQESIPVRCQIPVNRLHIMNKFKHVCGEGDSPCTNRSMLNKFEYVWGPRALYRGGTMVGVRYRGRLGLGPRGVVYGGIPP